jgi:hypothetical protein
LANQILGGVFEEHEMCGSSAAEMTTKDVIMNKQSGVHINFNWLLMDVRMPPFFKVANHFSDFFNQLILNVLCRVII